MRRNKHLAADYVAPRSRWGVGRVRRAGMALNGGGGRAWPTERAAMPSTPHDSRMTTAQRAAIQGIFDACQVTPRRTYAIRRGNNQSATPLVVVSREQLQLVGLLLVVIDEELRLVLCHQLPDFSMEAMDSGLFVFRDGTMFFSKFPSR